MIWTSLQVGMWNAAGAATGSMIGLAVASAAVWSFGDFFQLYHFTLVLACIGAGVAASVAIRHAIHHDRSSANARIIAGGLGLGLVSGLVGGVLANELSAALFGREFAIAAWGITGGTLGLTLAVWFEDLDPLPASSGGLCAGLLSGWLLFDPFANIIEIAMEAAGLGFSLGIAITVADSVLGNHSLPIASRLHDGG
jgi:hypothetical protein